MVSQKVGRMEVRMLWKGFQVLLIEYQKWGYLLTHEYFKLERMMTRQVYSVCALNFDFSR